VHDRHRRAGIALTHKRAWLTAALGIGLTAAAVTLPLGEWAIGLATIARNAGWLGVALFVLAYVVSTVALLPGSVLTLAAGFAYGPVWGLALASPASVAAATTAFLLGRTLFRGWAVRQAAASPRVRAIDQAISTGGFKLVLLLRLSPLFPFAVMNYALSASAVGLRTYVLASFLGMLPGTAMYVYLGSLVTTAAALTSGAPANRAQLLLYGAGLAATIAAALVATRAARRALDASHLSAK